MPAIEATGLHKTYRTLRGRSVRAVDGLDLIVEGPGVHGFLGPNGSGKTTTIRCLLGLVRPTDGVVRVLGRDVGELHKVVNRVGALVETPKFFPTFSGRKNLEMLARVAGVERTAVDRVLETVGLDDRATDRFSSYSLGMKQRLAVGATLLKEPELIVLDEPANGLDPAGIVEMRELIRRLADEGHTIFVSSHQLGEVQLTADVLTIIDHGRVLRTGSVADVVAGAAHRGLVVTIDDADGAAAVLLAAGFQATVEANDRVGVVVEPERGAAITAALAAHGRYLRGLEPRQTSLEDAFLQLTGGPAEGGAS